MPLATSSTCDNKNVSQTFTEQKYAVLRKSGTALVLPWLSLMAISGLTFFFYGRLTEVLHQQILFASAGVLALVLWLLPSLRFLTNRYEITSNRVVARSGFLGRKQSSVSWGEITGVSLTRGFLGLFTRSGNIHLHREFGVDLVLARVPKAKTLSRELERFLMMRTGVGQ